VGARVVIGLGWVEIFQFLVGLVALGPLSQNTLKVERIMLMHLKLAVKFDFTADLTLCIFCVVYTLRRCELDSRQLKTVTDRKLEV